ncbi:MAG: hypothetical protein R6V00_03495, partial [Candidatus Aminicenantes bacterium]
LLSTKKHFAFSHFISLVCFPNKSFLISYNWIIGVAPCHVIVQCQKEPSKKNLPEKAKNELIENKRFYSARPRIIATDYTSFLSRLGYNHC